MDQNSSLQITRSGAYDDDGHAKRTGNVKSAVAHIITAVIGSGILSLMWSIAQLGWIGGPLALLLCAAATCISSSLLSDCYRNPNPVTGKRNHSYMDAVRVSLGSKRTYVAGFLQYLVLYGTGSAYAITTATSLSAILKSNCYHKEGHGASCSYGGNLYMVLFGLVEILMSFIPDLHNMAWVSVIAAIMSFSYSFIGLGLGVSTVIRLFTLILSGKSKTSSEAVENDSTRNNKVRGVSSSTTNVMYHLKVLRVHQNGNLLIPQHQLALQVVKLELENFHLRNFTKEIFLQIIRFAKGRLE